MEGPDSKESRQYGSARRLACVYVEAKLTRHSLKQESPPFSPEHEGDGLDPEDTFVLYALPPGSIFGHPSRLFLG